MCSAKAPPNSRSGDSDASDPSGIQTLGELAAALKVLKGSRSYAELDKAVGGRTKRHALPPSTLSGLVNGKSVPTGEILVRFLTACGMTTEDEQEPWLNARERVDTVHLRRPAGAVRVSQADPWRLGVHASIQVEAGVESLPVYVPRDIDADLRTAITAAADRGGFVLVKGSSSVGKTRALFEGVRAVLPEWWLLHPADAAEVRAFADMPTPRTVVWLDELQRYLTGPTSLAVGVVRTLLAARLVVVATLWPGEYGNRAAPRIPGQPDDVYANDREVLGLARVIYVPNAFSRAERRRASDLSADRRIRVALDTAEDAGVTQVLAAGPQLISWWEHADVNESRQCYGKAVITAALDARRVGAHAPLTRDFLYAAAQAYLSSAQQATLPPDWFEKAVQYATTPLHGASSCLIPQAAGMGQVAGYITADYLHQYARSKCRVTPLPDLVWQTLIAHHHPSDTWRLADGAERRGRVDDAIRLYHRSAENGERFAVSHVADLLIEYGRATEALDVLSAAAEAENEFVFNKLADLLIEQGDVEAALRVLRVHAAGHQHVANRLVTLLVELREADEAVQVLQAQVNVDNEYAAIRLADLHIERGEVDEAIRVLRIYADIGRVDAANRLADLHIEHGEVDEAIRVLGVPADAGNERVANRLGELLVAQGRIDELRCRATTNNAYAAWLAGYLGKCGLVEELRVRADAGDRWAEAVLPDLLVGQGKLGELHQRAEVGRSWGAGKRLADLLEGKGEIDEAIRLVRVFADAGHADATHRLAELFAKHNRVDDLRFRAEVGHGYASTLLAELLINQNSVDEALNILRIQTEAGNGFAAEWLVDLLIERGNLDEALVILRVQADDDELAAERLLDLLAEHDRRAELEAEAQAGTRGAAERLRRG